MPETDTRKKIHWQQEAALIFPKRFITAVNWGRSESHPLPSIAARLPYSSSPILPFTYTATAHQWLQKHASRSQSIWTVPNLRVMAENRTVIKQRFGTQPNEWNVVLHKPTFENYFLHDGI